MGALTNAYEKLEDKIKRRLTILLNKKGYKSNFSEGRVLHVKEDLQFHIEDDRYLVEITDKELIDNSGYRYSLGCLETEKLCQVVDSL